MRLSVFQPKHTIDPVFIAAISSHKSKLTEIKQDQDDAEGFIRRLKKHINVRELTRERWLRMTGFPRQRTKRFSRQSKKLANTYFTGVYEI